MRSPRADASSEPSAQHLKRSITAPDAANEFARLDATATTSSQSATSTTRPSPTSPPPHPDGTPLRARTAVDFGRMRPSTYGFAAVCVQDSRNPRASAFDVLQIDGHSILTKPWEHRRDRLEALFADHALSPPWTLCPSTRDPGVAREWLEIWTRTPGIEGVVVKGLAQSYRPGARRWLKVRNGMNCICRNTQPRRTAGFVLVS
ncbi:hypothetical protein ACFVZE_15070 [Streptomyces anulatus]|uniref:ATP-dependent DNA ligase n=1 Tax=Streptomyces anulatus TaxID=1892 RepID=UPI0036DCB1B1